jgi:hypothetical protein
MNLIKLVAIKGALLARLHLYPLYPYHRSQLRYLPQGGRLVKQTAFLFSSATTVREERSRTMSSAKLLQPMLGLSLVVLLLAGCGGAQAVPTATPVPPTALPTPTPVPPTATPTQTPVPPTATPLPPPTATAIPEPLTAATVIAAGGDMSWDYVALGDSMTFGLVDKYADHIEADLGVEVTVHFWCRGSQGSDLLLRALRSDEELRSDIRQAEVVTFMVSTQHLRSPIHAYGAGTCGGPDNQDCLQEALALYKADTDAIMAEILSLRSTSDTIIRAMTYHNWLINDWKELGYFDDLNPYWVACNEYLVHAASEHHIPVARVDLAFNGPNGDEDPSDKGYLGPDKQHPNQEQGFALMAELFRELGYEPLAP